MYVSTLAKVDAVAPSFVIVPSQIWPDVALDETLVPVAVKYRFDRVGAALFGAQ